MGFFKDVFKKPAGLLGGLLQDVPFIGGAFSAYAEQEATRDANAASQLAAREQMGFQERMSSTAHQREVEDLKKAGLNPLLSANSGASSPGGASYTAEALPAGRYLATAMELKRQESDLKTQRSQRINLDVDTQGKDASAKNAELTGEGIKYENELMKLRNDFFKKNPWAFKLNAASGGLNSASSILRLLK